MKAWKGYFLNQKLAKKMLVIVVILVAAISFSFFTSLHYLIRSYDDNMYRLAETGLKQTIGDLNRRLNDISRLAGDIAADMDVQENMIVLGAPDMEHMDSRARGQAYDALYPYYDNNEYILSISLFVNSCVVNMGYGADLDSEKRLCIVDDLSVRNGDAMWLAQEDSRDTIACARMIRQRKYLKFTDLGAVYLIADLDAMIQDSMQDIPDEDDRGILILMDEHGRLVSGELEGDGTDYRNIWEKSHGTYQILRIAGGKRMFVLSGELFIEGWKYVYLLDYNSLFYHLSTVKMIMIAASALSVLLFLLITRRVLVNIFGHLELLIRKIHAYGQGQELSRYPEAVYRERQDEIGQLHRTFHEMTHSVKILRDENYDKQILLRDTTIKMLRQQINPHFLYNTLDTINWMALGSGSEEISTMVKALAKLYRASANNTDELISVQSELEYLDSYIQIQKIRYKDRLDFCTWLEDGVQQYLIPKLCIQPLVENAVKYSLECSMDVCMIRVDIHRSGKMLLVKVSNTGSAFAENVLEKLGTGELESQGTGIGLLNIEQRLKLLYGGECGLRAINENGMAAVILTIPHQRKEENGACNSSS